MVIRRAAAADIDTLVRLRVAFATDVRGGVPPGDGAGYAALLRDYFAAGMDSGDFVAVVGERDGEAVGSAFLSVHRSPPRPGQKDCRTGHITNVYVAPPLRRQGHATRLMEAVMAEGGALGITAFDLVATDAGRPVYEKLGFAVGSHPYMKLGG